MLADGAACQIHFSPKLVSVILVCSYHTDACPSCHFSNKKLITNYYLFDDIKRGCDIMINS